MVSRRPRALVAALLALVALLTPARATGYTAPPRQGVLDGGTTAVYAPDDPLLYGPAPSRFGPSRMVTVYRDGRLAGGWRARSSAALVFSSAPPANWRGRVMRVVLGPYGRIVLRAPTRIDARGGGYLTVVLNGGDGGGQHLAMALTYDGGQLVRSIPSSILMSRGAPRRQWVTVRIPVQNLVPAQARVDGVELREDAGLRGPALYIGAITLQAIPLASPAGDTIALSARIDASKGRHDISPYIYGLAGSGGGAYLRALRPTLIRWGGNQSSRYNWRIGHAWNAGRDGDYRNRDYGLHSGSVADATAARANRYGATMLFTIPTLGWVARDTHSFSFPDRLGRPGDSGGASCTNPGLRADASTTSVRMGPADMQAWVRHLLRDRHLNVRFFAMDNEPDLWGLTHYDVHPTCTGYDEIYREFTTYASAVKAVAPHALVTGPVSCCWQFYFDSMLGGSDRVRHDALGFLPWFLRQVRRYDRAHHRRTLDVLDVHYFPEGVDNADGDAVTAAWRLQETRSLWDPVFVDHSFIAQPVALIPRMQSLISYWYAGTRAGISAWNWGDQRRIDGALAVADVLGIYGQQGLYMAAYWTYPPLHSPAGLAFQLFRNYDGHGAAFGETSVAATSSNPSRLSIYASLRQRDGHLLVLLINKMPATWAATTLDLRGVHGGPARVYRYDAMHPGALVRADSFAVGAHTRVRVRPYSLLLLDVAP